MKCAKKSLSAAEMKTLVELKEPTKFSCPAGACSAKVIIIHSVHKNLVITWRKSVHKLWTITNNFLQMKWVFDGILRSCSSRLWPFLDEFLLWSCSPEANLGYAAYRMLKNKYINFIANFRVFYFLYYIIVYIVYYSLYIIVTIIYRHVRKTQGRSKTRIRRCYDCCKSKEGETRGGGKSWKEVSRRGSKT